MTGSSGSNLNRGEPVPTGDAPANGHAVAEPPRREVSAEGTGLDSQSTMTNQDAADPFLHLHKMSTTAGLGSGDYIAINGAAVAALLLGAASCTVLFNSLIFLVFPAVGVICGILAWIQISRSNGTQTGREIAAVGLLLALGFGGFSGAKTVYNSMRSRGDEHQIVAQLHTLGDDLKSDDYGDAYAVFDTQFRRHVSRADFESSWRRLSSSPYLGKLQSIDWNNLLNFDIDPVDESRIASGMMLMKFNPAEPLRIHMTFRNEDGSWLIDQVPEIFPTDKSGAATAPRQPAAKSSPIMGPPKP